MKTQQIIPQHIAIIMDGNGRWAKRRGLPRTAGHRAGMGTVRRVIKQCQELGVKVLTLYAFSAENWNRAQKEVDGLMKLLDEYLTKECPRFCEEGIRLRVMGRITMMPDFVQEKIRMVMDQTKNCDRLVLNLALSYSGRNEIIDAAKKIAGEVRDGTCSLDDIDEERFSAVLDTAGLPDPDFLIRTSGEMRISNFLLWQLSYAEFYVTETLWPDFSNKHFIAALDEYARRERRFGR